MSSSNQDRDDAPISPRGRVESGHYAVDLSNVHDDEATSRLPWDELVLCSRGIAELRVPGRPAIGHGLPLGNIDDAIVGAIGQWFGDETLRHWFAFRKVPVEQGRVSWRLSTHLAMVGDDATDETIERAAVEIDRITSISLTIWTPRRDLRLFAPLLVPIARTERGAGSRWLLRDMIVRVHPLLVPEDEGPATEPSEPSEDTLNERHTRTLGR